jgi:ABC-type lipoprotein release transport system permease subunit
MTNQPLHLSPRLVIAVAVFVLLVIVLAVVGKVPLKYNVRNLFVRWRTTLLTALAPTLVVGLMTFLLAFVNGLFRLTEGSGQAGNVMVLSDGATDELISNLGYGDVKEVELRDSVVKDEDGKPLASWEVYVVVNQPIPGAVKGGRQRRFTQVRGLDEPARSARVHNLSLADGTWFSSAGVKKLDKEKGGGTAIEAILGGGIARELGPDQGKKSLALDDVFELGDKKWVVVGLMQSGGSTFDSEIWAKRQLVGELFGKNSYTTAVLRTADGAAAAALAKDLTTNFKKPAVQAMTETTYFENLNTFNQQLLGAVLFVVLVMAIGGAFGVMNTMFAAISQRTKDIGVLRILGYARWQVLVSFFLESVVLALVGGLIGIAIGSICDGWTASSIVSSGQGGGGKSVVLRLTVDANIVLGGVLFSLAMGCIGGLIPALSAMRLKPLESLR